MGSNNFMKTAIATLPDHLFVSSTDGCLHDTRVPNWGATPLRADYQKTFARIDKLSQVKATLRAGSVTWPGCYPLFFITRDGAALCFDCARKEFRQVAWDFLNDCSTGWRISGCDVNYENQELTCDHCNKKIDSAYGN